MYKVSKKDLHGHLKILYYLKDHNITKWLESFFENRHQYTSWNGEISESQKNFELSVVQGSVLGPLLFDIYINDLCKSIDGVTVLFADDSNFIFSCKNTNDLNTKINKELKIIKEYLIANGLSINTEKTTFLHFVPKNKKRNKLEIKIGDKEIKEVECLRFLGVLIDNKLCFKQHFNMILKKIQLGLRGLIMTKNMLNY